MFMKSIFNFKFILKFEHMAETAEVSKEDSMDYQKKQFV